MRQRSNQRYGVSLAITAAMLVVMAEAPAAQAQRRNRNDNSNQGVPVATSAIVQNPGAYYGKAVTVSAGIERVLSKTAFVIDQRRAVSATEVKAIGKPLLVIAPGLNAALDSKHYVLMRGQIVKFDPAEIARLAPGYALDLAPELGAQYEGRPVMLASSVINSTFTEVTKKRDPDPPR